MEWRRGSLQGAPSFVSMSGLWCWERLPSVVVRVWSDRMYGNHVQILGAKVECGRKSME